MTGFPSSERDRYKRFARERLDGSTLMAAERLTGGLSANVVKITVNTQNGDTETLVLRRYGPIDTAEDPDIAAHESALLTVVRDHGVPAPEPIAFDLSGELFAEPVLVVRFVQGSTQFDGPLEDYLRQTADVMARIHAIDPIACGLTFLPAGRDPLRDIKVHLAAAPIDAANRAVIQAAIEPQPSEVGASDPALLHGDMFSGNLIWHEQRLAAVIDWEDAAIGDPLYDLAKCRVEFACEHGNDAADRLTELHIQSTHSRRPQSLFWWDVAVALRLGCKIADWGLPPADSNRLLAGVRSFVHHSIAQWKSTS